MTGLLSKGPDSPAVLLYNFTAKELEAWKFRMRGFPGIRLIPVPQSAYGLTLREILAGQTATAFAKTTAFFRPMLVFANIPEPLVHPLIAICRQITTEKVLKAMLTDTNRNWTSAVLYENLVEEEAMLGG